MESSVYIFAAGSLGLSLLNFFWWAPNLFCKSAYGRSRSSKVTNFRTNRKHICDFLLVRHSNLGPMLHRFRDIAAFLLLTHRHSNQILKVFPLNQITNVRVSRLIFEAFQPV